MKSRGFLRTQPARNGIQYVVNAASRNELKPIVFFDAGTFERNDNGFQIGFHPHSGIGIITYFHGTDLHHEDSGANDGIIHDGGAQWIRAGGGVWHQEAYRPKHDYAGGNWKGTIHQLWIQLPPEFEESEVAYSNLSRNEIPSVDDVKVLVGKYKGVEGKMDVPVNMTYLDVSLSKGQVWNFDTPEGQTTGFVFMREGHIDLGNGEMGREGMAVLEHNEGALQIEAKADAKFIVVLAEPSAFPIVSSGSQIHTNQDALDRSAARIRDIGLEMTH